MPNVKCQCSTIFTWSDFALDELGLRWSSESGMANIPSPDAIWRVLMYFCIVDFLIGIVPIVMFAGIVKSSVPHPGGVITTYG